MNQLVIKVQAHILSPGLVYPVFYIQCKQFVMEDLSYFSKSHQNLTGHPASSIGLIQSVYQFPASRPDQFHGDRHLLIVPNCILIAFYSLVDTDLQMISCAGDFKMEHIWELFFLLFFGSLVESNFCPRFQDHLIIPPHDHVNFQRLSLSFYLNCTMKSAQDIFASAYLVVNRLGQKNLILSGLGLDA